MKRLKKRSVEPNGFEIITGGKPMPFPLEIFPDTIQYIVKELKKSANFEEQVSGSTILFVVSTIIGLSRKIIVKSGAWEDTPNIWVAIVGRRGTMKTPTSSYFLKPLVNAERDYADEFKNAMASWLSVDKNNRTDETRPKRRQRYSSDTTVEGLIDALEHNPNGMGIYKDELNGFFEEMSRYKAGGNLEFYLSAFSGGAYIKNRKSYDAQTIDNIYLSILGSIQPEVLRAVAVHQTQNGMIDRWLFTVSDDVVPHTTDDDIPYEYTQEYNTWISGIMSRCREPLTMQWTESARKLFFDSVNEIEDMMKNDNIDQQLFTYLSKMKTYFARFVIICATMNGSVIVNDDYVLMAKLLVGYYVGTAYQTFISFDNQLNIEQILKIENATTKKQKVIAVKKHLPDISVTKLAEFSGCTRAYASDVIGGKR